MSAALPILYSFRRCPYAMRARLALAVSGQEVEHREVSLKAKPLEMLAASPKGTVPVLVLPDGRVIDESLDIMRWALTQNDPEGWLHSGDATDALFATNDGPFKHHLDRAKYPGRYGPTDEDHYGAGVAMLYVLEQRLAASSYLLGSKASLADYALFPFVRQFAAIDLTAFAALPVPKLQRWLHDIGSSKLFLAVMEKHSLWVSDQIAPESL